MKFLCFTYGLAVAALLERRVGGMALDWSLYGCWILALSRLIVHGHAHWRDGWLRIGRRGWGLRWKDTRDRGLMYSERAGHHRQMRLGPWLVRVLPPVGREP